MKMMDRNTSKLFYEMLQEMTPKQGKKFSEAMRKRFDEKTVSDTETVFLVTKEDLIEIARQQGLLPQDHA